MLRHVRKILAFAVLATVLPLASPASAVVQVFTCNGGLVNNEVRADNVLRTTSSTSFVPIPGTTTSLQIPNSSCVKVLFTAETTCVKSAASDICDIRAVVNGVEMHPQAGGTQIMDSESGGRQAHAYEWIARLGENPYTLRIEWKVRNAATRFEIDDWTMDIMRVD